MLLLETIRGCIYKCKFCYYPKSYDDLYYVAEEKIVANLRHARERGATEVVLLDPTLNQGRNFDKFVELLAREKPRPPIHLLRRIAGRGDQSVHGPACLKQANFSDVENRPAVDRPACDGPDGSQKQSEGVRARRAGLARRRHPREGRSHHRSAGDTLESVRPRPRLSPTASSAKSKSSISRSCRGTAFRYEAEQLGLEFQKRTPYYVMRTPTLDFGQMHTLMSEAQQLFDIEFDPWEDPQLSFTVQNETWPPPRIAVRLRFRADSFSCWKRRSRFALSATVRGLRPPPHPRDAEWRRPSPSVLSATNCTRSAKKRPPPWPSRFENNPHGTFQIVCEPTGDPSRVTAEAIEALLAAAFGSTSYLDRFYAVMPGRPKGAKRVLVVVPVAQRERLGREWADEDWTNSRRSFGRRRPQSQPAGFGTTTNSSPR